MKSPLYLTTLLGLFLLYSSSTFVTAEQKMQAVALATTKTSGDERNLSSTNSSQNSTSIEIEPSSLEELKLDNTTLLALGPNSRIKLDRGTNNRKQLNHPTLVSLEKGPFRLITNSSDKKDLQIQTPNLSITSEASVLDVYIASNGAEYLLLHTGMTKVCKNGAIEPSSCKLLETPCNLVRISPNGKIGDPLIWRERTTELELTFSETFPFVLSPPQSDPVIYHSRLGIEDNKCSSPTLASEKLNAQQSTYETGAIPDKKEPTSSVQTIKTPENLTSVPSKVKVSKSREGSKVTVCIECEYVDNADKYVIKILRQADTGLTKLWNTLTFSKNSKKL